jgi:hypothetical protein
MSRHPRCILIDETQYHRISQFPTPAFAERPSRMSRDGCWHTVAGCVGTFASPWRSWHGCGNWAMPRLCRRHTMPLVGETFRPSKRQPFEARPATGCCTNWLSSSASAMKQFVRPCAPREPLMLGVGLLPNESPLRRRIGHQRGRRRTVVLIRQGLNLRSGRAPSRPLRAWRTRNPALDPRRGPGR